MLPLFDMMLRAQNGTAMEAMAKQFGLAQEQAAKAMAALTPAFASGFKRNAANPYDLSSLFEAMSSANYARYFEDMNAAFTPQGIADGNKVLQQIFGSKEVSRAIAAQVSQLTGIGQDILKQMMPVMADTLMGGLFKQTTGQFASTDSFATNPMGAMIQQWLESTGFQPKRPAPPTMFDNPFTRAFQEMMGAQPKQPAAPANPFLDNPFTKAFQEMAASYGASTSSQTGEAQKPAGAAEPTSEGASAPAEQFSAMINTLFDSGLEVQKTYQKNMEQIFDRYVASTKGQAGTAIEPPGKG